jgi:hypothetical protein
MNFTDLINLLPKIMPLLPRLTKAVNTIEKVTADPDVKDALLALEQLMALLQQPKIAPK